MNLSIIIITFNAKNVTVEMLRSLKQSLVFVDKHSRIDWEVIVVDNGSTDGVADAVEKEFSDWVKLIRSTNEGFAKGNNRGIRHTDDSSKYVLLLNPDIILEEDTISKMYDYMIDNSAVGLSTCQVDMWSGGYDIDAHRGFPTPWPAMCYFTFAEKLLAVKLADALQKHLPKTIGGKIANILRRVFGGYHLLDRDMQEDHEIDVCLGAFMMIPREVGEKTNWLPEDYFLNGEDVDLCYQIKEIHNYKIMYTPRTKVIHYKGASKGTKKQSEKITTATSSTKDVQINSGIDAMKLFYKKYYDDRYPWFVTMFVYFGIWLLHKKRLLLKRE